MFVLVLFSVLFPESSPGLVAVGNGNYYVGFTDLEHDAPPNSFQLRIHRTYNSRSQFDGIFGYGWGTEYEAFLIPSADGSVVIQESGAGDRTRFSPQEFSKAELVKQVDRLVEAYLKKVPGTRSSELRERLLNSANERDEKSRELGIFPQLPEGTRLFSTQRGDKQSLTVHRLGYLREFADGKRELFGVKADVADQGVDPAKQRILKGVYRVSRFSDPVRKAEIQYEYDARGRVVSVSVDKRAQLLRFRYNEAGKVVEVTDKNGTKASYEYCASSAYDAGKKCGRGDLVRSKDTSGASYSFQYDSLHNLTRIGSPKNGKPDGEFEEISYWPASSDGLGGVRSIRQPNGNLVEYTYWQDPKDREGHYRTGVKTTYASGRVSQNDYEYFEKKRADGSRYRYKLLSTVDEEKTETIYNECCGQPLQVTTNPGAPGQLVTKYEYFAGSGLAKEKDSPAENVKWEYSTKFHGKITKVVVNDKASNSVRSSEFEYDKDKGQLVKARTSDGKGILLIYDSAGRIATMVDQDKRKISFRYATNAKPSEIIQEGVGSIQVSYDKAGQIKDVKSKGGRQIAISVAAAFQNLLEIIKPAGIQPI